MNQKVIFKSCIHLRLKARDGTAGTGRDGPVPSYSCIDVSSTEVGTDSALDLTTTDSETRIRPAQIVLKNMDRSQNVDTLLDMFVVKSNETMSDASGFLVDELPKITSSPKIPVMDEQMMLRPFVKVIRLKDADIPQRQPTPLETRKIAKLLEAGEDIDSTFEEDPEFVALRQEEYDEKVKKCFEENPREAKVNRSWGMRGKALNFRKYMGKVEHREN